MFLPYPITFTIIGLAAGLLYFGERTLISSHQIMFFLIPPLLFEAAWNLHLDVLRRTWLCVTLLATVGVVISMMITAGILSAAGVLPWTTALVFGSIVAATDPVSVVAVFRKIGIAPQLTTILEGESLFNDGVAICLFNIVLAACLHPDTSSLASAPMTFVTVALGGAAFGLIFGYLAEMVARLVKNDIFEIALTIAVAYLSFWLPEQLHISPILSVLCAAMVMGTQGQKDLTKTVWLEIDQFWSVIALVVNAVVFFIIGAKARVVNLGIDWMPISVAILAILAARLAVVVPLCSVASLMGPKVPFKSQTLLYWGGLRGALSMVMALSLPEETPQRQLLIVMTFGVVLFTLLAQGITIEPLITLLKIKSPEAELPAEAAPHHP